jgi:pre-mRNA-splicing factor 18
MDLLKRELARKKKSVEKAKANAGGRRFFRAGDLRRQEEEEDNEEKEKGRKRKLTDEIEPSASSSNKHRAGTKESGNNEETEVHGSATNDNNLVESNGNDGEAGNLKLSLDDITKRLRMLGHPIKLFGETTTDRVKRLRKALDEQKNLQAGLSEMEEFRLGRGHGIRNPFLEKDDKVKRAEDPAEAADEVDKKEGDDTKDNDNDNNELDENDPHKRVYKYFKGLIKTWEADLNERPESVKRSVAGRNETKTMKQCKDYIRPLFKLCKNRRVDEGILTKLNRIVSFCLEEEFVKAHDTYIDISIGRAAWPIGVTMVGIHARTGRAKIESSNVAHVMNSELQRKYLTSVKRLMSYAQKKSNADPSKKVL